MSNENTDQAAPPAAAPAAPAPNTVAQTAPSNPPPKVVFAKGESGDGAKQANQAAAAAAAAADQANSTAAAAASAATGAVSAVDRLAALIEGQTKAKVEAEAAEAARAAALQEFRARAIEAAGILVPELVVGSTEDEIRSSVSSAQALQNRMHEEMMQKHRANVRSSAPQTIGNNLDSGGSTTTPDTSMFDDANRYKAVRDAVRSRHAGGNGQAMENLLAQRDAIRDQHRDAWPS